MKKMKQKNLSNHEEIYDELIFHSQNLRHKNEEEGVKYKEILVVKKLKLV
jgi:hypothetical protein